MLLTDSRSQCHHLSRSLTFLPITTSSCIKVTNYFPHHRPRLKKEVRTCLNGFNFSCRRSITARYLALIFLFVFGEENQYCACLPFCKLLNNCSRPSWLFSFNSVSVFFQLLFVASNRGSSCRCASYVSERKP